MRNIYFAETEVAKAREMQVSLIGFCGVSKVGDNKVYNNVLHFAKSTI